MRDRSRHDATEGASVKGGAEGEIIRRLIAAGTLPEESGPPSADSGVTIYADY